MTATSGKPNLHKNGIFSSAITQSLIYTKSNDLHKVIFKETAFAERHQERLPHHVNVEAIQQLDISDLMRRLKEKKNLLSWCKVHPYTGTETLYRLYGP